MRPTHGHGLLTTSEAAQRVGVKPATFRSWRRRGWVGPQGLDEHGHPLYSEAAAVEAELTVRRNGLRASGIDPRVLRRAQAA